MKWFTLKYCKLYNFILKSCNWIIAKVLIPIVQGWDLFFFKRNYLVTLDTFTYWTLKNVF